MGFHRLGQEPESQKLLAAYLWLSLVGVLVLIVMYFWTLLHTCAGSKYKFVINLLVMLLLSNFATLCVVYTNWKLFYLHDYVEGYVWLLALSVGVQDCMFNISHFVLAQKYRGIAKKVPLLLEKRRPQKPLKEVMIESLLMTMNILVPLVEAILLVPFNTQALINNQAPATALLVCEDTAAILTGVF